MGKKRIFKQILIWLGILFGCALISAMLWMVLFHGSTSIHAQKWLQVISVIGTFMMPAILCAYLWDEEHIPERWLKMDRGTDWHLFLMAIAIMIVALPAINLLAELNGMIPMPEEWVKADQDAETVIREFLRADGFGAILVNLGLLALLPAIAEEMTFRGTLQQILWKGEELSVTGYRMHLAIWLTAIIFSAIHLQFLGFIPRMLMGALFGYMFVWTGTLWIPIVMHFTNNAFSIGLYYLLPENSNADSFGAGTTWWVGVLSLMLTCLGLLIFYRRTHKQ